MATHDRRPGRVDRRTLLLGSGAALVLVACGKSEEATTSSTTATSSRTGSTGSSGGAAGATPSTGSSGPATTTGAAPTELTAADFAGLGTCMLLPEKTAGPFPLDEQFDRRDITEDYPGQPMRLGLRVLDESCEPVPDAAVEIWHCDATGDYSAFTDGGGGKDEGSGTTFLRGTQTANQDGIVEFLTIVPGWYRGRAVHIHLRVHLDDATVLTSQMFFDADYLASVYAADPYAANGLPDTSNERDSIAGDPAAEGTLLVTTAAETAKGAGTLALLNLGIDPSARSSATASSSAGGPGGARGRR